MSDISTNASSDGAWLGPYIKTSLMFIVLGYLVYFSALLLPAPLWARELIDYLTPILKSLRSAARVAAQSGKDPFPVQTMIIYSVAGWFVLLGLFSWLSYSNSMRRAVVVQIALKQYRAQKASKAGVFTFNLFFLCLSIGYLVALPFMGVTQTGTAWRLQHIFSPNIFPVTLFWIAPTLLLSLASAMAPIGIYLSLSSLLTENQGINHG